MPKRKSSLFTRVKRRTSTPNARSQATPSSLSRPAFRPLQPQTAATISENEEDDLIQPHSNAHMAPRQLAGHKRKRPQSPPRSTSPEDSDPEADELARAKFPILKPRERFIAQNLVRSKWEPLPEPAQERVLDIFAAVETPLVALQRDEKKRVESQTILAQLLRTLGRRLPRMPFPPGTRDVAFDLEGLLRGNRSLEQQVTPALHSIALLKTEIRREKERVERDRKELDELKRNAQHEEKVWRKKVSKSHRLLEQKPKIDLEDQPEDIMFTEEPNIQMWSRNKETELFLRPAMHQIWNHLGSMDSNVGQLEGLSDQVAFSARKLDAVLYERLSKGIYNQLPDL